MQPYKFQKLRVYEQALEYIDMIYALSAILPDTERFNLKSQIERAATSIALNIAEGSTGQSDAEQSRFLSMALRSHLETVACLDIIQRRDYRSNTELAPIRSHGYQLFTGLLAFRRQLSRQ